MLNNIPDPSSIAASLELRRDTLPPLLALLSLRNSVAGLSSLASLRQCRIARIEGFRFDGEHADKLRPGCGDDYCCGLLAITANSGAVGLGEFAVPCKSLNGDFVMWASPFQRMKGQSVLESFQFVQNKQDAWGPARSALIASALLNLNENLDRAAANEEDRTSLWNRSSLLPYTQAYVSF